MVVRVELPQSFAVTDLTAQSPLAAHLERKPLVTLRWITARRGARSQVLFVTSTLPGKSWNVSSFGLAREFATQFLGHRASGWCAEQLCQVTVHLALFAFDRTGRLCRNFTRQCKHAIQPKPLLKR